MHEYTIPILHIMTLHVHVHCTFADDPLLLNLTVDDNTRRLEKLEAAGE